MYHECDLLVDQVISGYLESEAERKDGSLSDETFEKRMIELEQMAGKAKSYIKELESYSENEYKTAKGKFDKLTNSLFYRIPNGFISLLLRLANKEEDPEKEEAAEKGVQSGAAIAIGLVFGIFVLWCSTAAEGFYAFIMFVIGLLFISIPIVAIVSRVLCRPLERWYGTYIWMHGKENAMGTLYGFFGRKEYNDPEQHLANYILKWAKKDEDDFRPMIHGIMQEMDDRFESMLVNGKFLSYKCAIIVFDFMKETTGELPQDGKEVFENAKREWRSIYVQYEA